MRVRESYVNAGSSGIDIPKADAWGIQRLWFESTDPLVTKNNLTAHSGRVGVKVNGASVDVATDASQLLTDLGFGSSTSPGSCGMMFDPEPFHAAAVQQLLGQWRLLRPKRYTVVTIPPWQGGLFTPELVRAINGDPNLLLGVQLYMTLNGDELYPASPRAIDVLEAMGVYRWKMVPFLPVKSYAGVGVEIPYGWDGVLWVFNDLPATPPVPL